MKVKLFNENVKMPKKSHLPDCGLDLYLPRDIVIMPFSTVTFGLGIGFSIPEGYAGMLVPRSSMAMKGLIIATAIIDPAYTGEIHLIATNCSQETIHLHKDDRVCSICCYNVLNPYLELVDELPQSERGNAGLGSTGN